MDLVMRASSVMRAFALKLFIDVCLRIFSLELGMWLRGSRSLGFDPQKLTWLLSDRVLNSASIHLCHFCSYPL